MSDKKNLYDRMAGIESKIDDVVHQFEELILSQTKDSSSTEQNQIKPHFAPTVQEQRIALKRFISTSQKEYMWCGSIEDFTREKKKVLYLIFAYIIVGIVSTLVSSISLKIYSTFTIFENIWLIMVALMIIPTVRAKRYYDCLKIPSIKCFNYDYDQDGVCRMGALKKSYKVFFVLNCIAAVLNAISIWFFRKDAFAVVVTVLEVITAIFSGVSFYFVMDFFCGYGVLRFTGKNFTTGERVVLFFDPLMNTLFSEEDYKKRFPFPWLEEED